MTSSPAEHVGGSVCVLRPDPRYAGARGGRYQGREHPQLSTRPLQCPTHHLIPSEYSCIVAGAEA